MDTLCYLTEQQYPVWGLTLVGRLPTGETIYAIKVRKKRGQPRQWQVLIDRSSMGAEGIEARAREADDDAYRAIFNLKGRR